MATCTAARAIPSLDGVYVYGDDCRPQIVGVVQQNGKAVAARATSGRKSQAVTTFGEDPSGELYVGSRDGMVFEFTNG